MSRCRPARLDRRLTAFARARLRMDLVLEHDGGRGEQQQPQQSDRTARDSPGPSTPERAMERQLIQKAEQLERSFADAFSDLRAEDAGRSST